MTWTSHLRSCVVLAGVALGLGLGGTAIAAEQALAGATPKPAIQPARGGECVADPAFMRRNHMDLLKHQRKETVHLGVKDARVSLKGCIECHASAETGSVATAKTDFCVSCHSYASVKVDCFDCHASKPQNLSFLPLVHPGTANAATRLAARSRELLKQGSTRP